MRISDWSSDVCSSDLYPGVLLGLFVIASGITILQVAANPLAAALGVPERSHFRLTLSQAFNSLGTVLGPLLGATLLLKGVEVKPGEVIDATARSTALGGIRTVERRVGKEGVSTGRTRWWTDH